MEFIFKYNFNYFWKYVVFRMVIIIKKNNIINN